MKGGGEFGRWSGIAALAVVVAAGLSACGAAPPTHPRSTPHASAHVSAPVAPVAVTLQYSTGFTGVLPLLIANEAGFYNRADISANFVATNEAITTCLSGSADFCTPSPVVAAEAVSQGEGVQIVMTIQDRITQSLVVSPKIASGMSSHPGDFPGVLRDLKGHTIGVTVIGGSPDPDLEYMLKTAGMDPSTDVHIVALGTGGGEAAALKAGEVDAILTFTPVTQLAVQGGYGVNVLDLAKGQGPKALDQPFVVLACTTLYAKTHSAVARRVVGATAEAMTYIRDPKNRAVVLSDVQNLLPGISVSIAKQIVTELSSTMEPGFSDSTLSAVNTVLQTDGILTTPITAGQIVDRAVVPAG